MPATGKLYESNLVWYQRLPTGVLLEGVLTFTVNVRIYIGLTEPQREAATRLPMVQGVPRFYNRATTRKTKI